VELNLPLASILDFGNLNGLHLEEKANECREKDTERKEVYKEIRKMLAVSDVNNDD